MGGGAWPFLVGGVICLVNSVNERDLSLLTSWAKSQPEALVLSVWQNLRFLRGLAFNFLEGLLVFSQRKFEAITGL